MVICPQCKQRYAPGPTLCWTCRVPLEGEGTSKLATGLIIGGAALAFVFVIVAMGVSVISDRKDPSTAAQIKQTESIAANNTAPPTPKPTPDYSLSKRDAQELLSRKPDDYGSTSVKDFDVAINDLNTVGKGAANYKEAQKFIVQLEKKRSDIEDLGEAPESSKWDGSVQPVKEYLRRNLNDYDSSEFVEWSPVRLSVVKNIPYWTVRLRLRAKNAFGGYILRDTYYFVRGGQVVNAEGLNG